ncbi:MAG TPA: hypothetical protein DDX92_00120 [Flavobacteriales bacterium]|jgi:transglutaminase-like putative cysteine protease|nr:hypothetical protein [Flavobacteriales bacterium]
MKYANIFTLSAALFVFTLDHIASELPFKFGKIKDEVVKAKAIAAFPNADAVVLYDYGTVDFDYTQTKGFTIILERTCRIKILKNSGYDWAQERILLYDDDEIEEKVIGLKGNTYNYENGKVVKTKLGKEHIFREDQTDTWQTLSFTLPQVKEGSVIEFTYRKSTNYFSYIDPWYFQRSIPVQHSEYIFKAPEFFNYMPVEQGYVELDVREPITESDKITFTEKERDGMTRSKTNYSTQSIDFMTNGTRYVARNVPGLKEEPKAPELKSFQTHVAYQLSTVRYPGSPIEKVLSDWEKINKELMENPNFGGECKPRSFYKEALSEIKANNTETADQIAAIHQHVRNKTSWNGVNAYFASNGIRKTYINGEGNSADINLLLVSMLKSAGYESNPVILSTRSNGMVNPSFPIMRNYNYVVAEVIVGNNSILLDATDPNLPAGLLPKRVLNNRGRRISMKGSDWVLLRPYLGENQVIYVNSKLDANGTISGKWQSKYSGYSTWKIKAEKGESGEDLFIKDRIGEMENGEVENYSLTPYDDKYEYAESFDFQAEGYATVAPNVIYLNPFAVEHDFKNPFKDNERLLPVDLIVPKSQTQNVTIQIPEGYVVDEIPEQVNVQLPNEDGQFKYTIRSFGGMIQLQSVIEINRTFYSSTEYSMLKEFFDLIFQKTSEEIVLKRKS